MSMTSLLTFTPWPALSAVILLVLLVAALYFARSTAHQAIHAACGALARGLRLASHSVTHAQEHLVARNRAVLLAAGREAKERIVGYIDRSEGGGARLALDGRGIRVPGHENGFFVGPTIIDRVTPGMEIYQDEIFGPVLSVLRAETADQAIDLVNANPYGNGTALFTSSGEAARKFHRGVKVGMIGINVPIPVPMAYYSFGGWKDSLFGERRIHGPEGVAFYTRSKVVTSRWPTPRAATGASYQFPTTD